MSQMLEYEMMQRMFGSGDTMPLVIFAIMMAVLAFRKESITSLRIFCWAIVCFLVAYGLPLITSGIATMIPMFGGGNISNAFDGAFSGSSRGRGDNTMQTVAFISQAIISPLAYLAFFGMALYSMLPKRAIERQTVAEPKPHPLDD